MTASEKLFAVLFVSACVVAVSTVAVSGGWLLTSLPMLVL